MSVKLTKKQQATLNFIHTNIKNDQISPTLTEIAQHFNISVTAAAQRVSLLNKKGIVSRPRGRSRAIIPTKIV